MSHQLLRARTAGELVQLEFAYEYGSLDPFGIGGGVTQFFQTRLQVQV